MNLAAIPVKQLGSAKSRLSVALSPGEREALMVTLVRRAVQALRDSGQIHRIALATAEADLTRELGVDMVPEGHDLNEALQAAVRWAESRSADRLLILPADLPLVSSSDITAVVTAAGRPPSVVLAPTLDGGTGALVLSPPSAIAPSFGGLSFERHRQRAAEAGVEVTVVHRSGLARDLDTPDDLQLLAATCDDR